MDWDADAACVNDPDGDGDHVAPRGAAPDVNSTLRVDTRNDLTCSALVAPALGGELLVGLLGAELGAGVLVGKGEPAMTGQSRSFHAAAIAKLVPTTRPANTSKHTATTHATCQGDQVGRTAPAPTCKSDKSTRTGRPRRVLKARHPKPRNLVQASSCAARLLLTVEPGDDWGPAGLRASTSTSPSDLLLAHDGIICLQQSAAQAG